ncbi:SusC/RagA family TonB-linked outer membrane protein [Pedobacter sp. MC2016-14]|uniref:SusC/RagA family TonB-linked outer membrane protein n=1 Tax=Pedobacter sp. MC2016-14 TaxID=2897327 RepID=UPI001E4F7E34|nr:SusC/RagA family TonB-linked outer membrane protein [Pedobacter sp. MC2016-14]MCD0488625.1 SusC/RagA family TonB-linked outer membrane protein [Pedobacter sp. MC2016-14]
MYKNYTKKLLRIMRITTVILIATIMQVSASGFAQKITLSENGVTLKHLFTEIRKQSGYNFLYTDQLLAQTKMVTIKVDHAELKEVLEELFKNQPLTYTVDDRTVIVKEKPVSLLSKIAEVFQLPVVVEGKVTDTTGTPMPGALIRSSKGIFITGPSGRFSIKTELGDNIIVSFLGYDAYSFIAREKMPFQNIQLRSLTAQLSEVKIQTGFQTLSKERATGAYAKPDMEVFKNRTGTTNIITRLEGLIPGMTMVPGPRITVSRNGSSAGNQSIIRGTSSIYVNPDPLYVVNNVMVEDITNINPDDVADITVLKDAAAVAIWGSKAANGVIVITTKTGGKKQNLKIGYNSYVNFAGKPDFDYRPVMSSREFINAARETFSATDYPLNTLTYNLIAPHELILYNQNNLPQAQVNAKLDSLAAINNMDQVKQLFYRNAMSSNQTISASAGGEVYSFYGSLSYNNVTSNRPGEKNNLYRFNFAQDLNVSKRISVSLNTTLTSANNSGVANLSIDNQFLPYQLFADANGTAISMPYLSGWSETLRREYEQRGRISLNYVPLDEPGYSRNKSNNIVLNLNGKVTVDVWKGLSFRGTYGYLKSPGNSESFNDIRSFASRKELLSNTVSPTITSVPVYYLPTTGGRYSTSNTDQQNWTLRNQLIFQHSFRGGKDRLSLEGGQDIQEQFLKSRSTTVYGYNEALMTSQLPDYAAINRGINPIIYGNRPLEPVSAPIENLQRFTSWFGLANYSFAGKYNIDASWRIDQSNLFGKDKSAQNKPVWSIGGKWLMAKENFMKDISWLNELSIRATYGIAGNSPQAAAGSNFNILGADYGTNPGGTSISVQSPSNNKLIWEATRTKNLGLDVSVFRNRLGFSLDIYDKHTTDLLGSLILNPLSGYSAVVGNIGELTNKGVDLSIRSLNVQSRDFKWSSNLVFSYNRNKLVDYGVPSPYANQAGSKIYSSYFAGYGLLPLFAYQYAGLDNTGSPMIRLQDGSVTKSLYVAQGDDVVYQGTIMPVFNGGFSNTFSYKNLSVTANMIYNMGHVMRRDVNQFYTGRLSGSATSFNGNISPEFNNRWKKPGDEAFTDIPAYVANMNDHYNNRDMNYYLMGDGNVVDASYIKLRDITLNYVLPKEVLKAVKIASASVFVQATNFMVWKANKYNIDPEFHNLSTGARSIPPFKHSYSIGTNITF